jgi:hypothetical protein
MRCPPAGRSFRTGRTSLRHRRSPFPGNAILRGRDNGIETGPLHSTNHKPTNSELFLRYQEISVCGWEDSNFQPMDYQSLALSSRHRWPAPAWHGRRSPHRLAGGIVPTAPDARPSCAVIARIFEQSVWVVASVRGNGIFAAETKPPKPFH